MKHISRISKAVEGVNEINNEHSRGYARSLYRRYLLTGLTTKCLVLSNIPPEIYNSGDVVRGNIVNALGFGVKCTAGVYEGLVIITKDVRENRRALN